MMNLKKIHIGELIKNRVSEVNIESSRLLNFMGCDEKDISKMYKQENLPTDVLLKFCKILDYDFFRLYSQHLILYAPTGKSYEDKKQDKKTSTLPQFRKNLYNKEIIDYILNKINTNSMTITQVIDRYKIPKTTLYKWLKKYNENKYDQPTN
ncbi:transposase [Empedobacter stercoris]|uniref:transposase n=1 Tax=Empedobacter stercoris TaxID=1628248 RepID=UPI00293D7EE5|nr:transposase [Empedobacter stercoris]